MIWQCQPVWGTRIFIEYKINPSIQAMKQIDSLDAHAGGGRFGAEQYATLSPG
jgi:hypothetical protein